MAHVERLTDLDALCGWMRTNNVRRAKLADMELEFERAPLPLRPVESARLKTAEEIAAERKEARRRQYSIELGTAVTDEMLEKLP